MPKRAADGSREPAPLKFPPQGKLARAWARVLGIALALPLMEESRSYGTPALKVRKKLVGRLRSEAEGGLALRCEIADREVLIQADPDAFYVTDHYRSHPMVLIDLHAVSPDVLEELIEQAWRALAPKKAVDEYDRPRAGSSGDGSTR